MNMLYGGFTNAIAAAFMTHKLKEVQKNFLVAVCKMSVEDQRSLAAQQEA